MKNKVINLFGDKGIIQNEGAKYSELIDKFIAPFENDFPDDFYIEDIFEFAINTWNLANMSLIVPKDEFKNIMSSAPDSEGLLLKKMLAYKISNFKEFDHFISDFEITEVDGNPILTVLTESKETYMENLMNTFDHDLSEDDFKENFINRYAVVLKPKQPFYDWINNLYPGEEVTEIDRTNTYLVDDGIEDLDKWLQKKFDKLFMMELNGWHTNKREWPQKRNFKMFKQWFQINISDMVYDLENTPVRKEE